MNDRDQDHEQQQQQQPASASSKACEGRELNHYEQRQEAKRERLLERADKARKQGEQLHNRAQEMVEVIPFGQPILVGHHSEGKDRRFRKKIHDTTHKAFAQIDKAKYLEGRAASVGTGGISSDDPDAIDKLREQLAKAEKKQADMKAANAAIRKGKTPEDQVARLRKLGLSEKLAVSLLEPDFMGRVGFPTFALSNNNANLKRIKQRIAQLEQVQNSEPVEIEGDGYEYQECPVENRVMFTFPGKPAEEIRAVLKRHAFKWSPSRGAWVRMLNASGRRAGEYVRNQLDGLTD